MSHSIAWNSQISGIVHETIHNPQLSLRAVQAQHNRKQFFLKEIRKAHSTCILCLGSFGVVSTHLQVQELHYLLFESHTGHHIHPDIQYGRQQLLPKVTHPHPTVHGRGSQEDVESRDEVLQYRQLSLLPNTITGVWEKKKPISAFI